MSDEPVEDGNSGSDAEGASTSADTSERSPPEDADGADAVEGDSSPGEAGTDEADLDAAGDEPEPTDDGEPTDASESSDAVEPADSDGSADAGDSDRATGSRDRHGRGRARMGSRPSPEDDAPATPDPGEHDDRVSHCDPDDADDAGEPSGQPRYATDRLDSDDAPADPPTPTPVDEETSTEHPDASGTPDDRPSHAEDAPRGSAHAPVGAEAPNPDEGETPAAASTTDAGSSGGSSILSGGIGGTAPPDDEEMPLTEHIEEMLTRLGIVVVVAAFATLAAFPFANDAIIHMWYDVHYGTVEVCKTAPQSGDCVAPHVYGPLELVLTRIRVAGLAGLLVALPLGIYQTYRFMRPGLYPHERRYFLASVPFSLVLGIVGMLFAYFVLLPLLFAYFISYTQGSADLAFQLAETMNLILLMMGMLAIVFQIPLLIMLAIMMGITTRRWLERRRLYFWGLFLGVAVIFGPDPTGMAPFLLMATMVALFEGTLLLLRWTGR